MPSFLAFRFYHTINRQKRKDRESGAVFEKMARFPGIGAG